MRSPRSKIATITLLDGVERIERRVVQGPRTLVESAAILVDQLFHLGGFELGLGRLGLLAGPRHAPSGTISRLVASTSRIAPCRVNSTPRRSWGTTSRTPFGPTT